MRGKSTTRNVAGISSTTKDKAIEAIEAVGATPATSVQSIPSKRAADVFASYSTGNIDFDSGVDSTDRTSSIGKETSSGSSSPVDISDGAKRLAKELDHYIASVPDNEWDHDNTDNGSALSDDAVADLQLATARKLREVGSYKFFHSHFSKAYSSAALLIFTAPSTQSRPPSPGTGA